MGIIRNLYRNQRLKPLTAVEIFILVSFEGQWHTILTVNDILSPGLYANTRGVLKQLKRQIDD